MATGYIECIDFQVNDDQSLSVKIGTEWFPAEDLRSLIDEGLVEPIFTILDQRIRAGETEVLIDNTWHDYQTIKPVFVGFSSARILCVDFRIDRGVSFVKIGSEWYPANSIRDLVDSDEVEPFFIFLDQRSNNGTTEVLLETAWHEFAELEFLFASLASSNVQCVDFLVANGIVTRIKVGTEFFTTDLIDDLIDDDLVQPMFNIVDWRVRDSELEVLVGNIWRNYAIMATLLDGNFSISSLPNLLQLALDGSGYRSDLVNGIPVLESKEPYGTYRAPLSAACYETTGQGSLTWFNQSGTQYYSYYDVTLSQWVEGTCDEFTTARLIVVPANTKLRNLKRWSDNSYSAAERNQEDAFGSIPTNLLSWHHCNETGGTISYDCLASGSDSNAILGSIGFGTDPSVVNNPANTLGHTNNAGVIVPRDERDPTKDVVGNPLQYSGQCPYPISVHVPYGQFIKATKQHVDMPASSISSLVTDHNFSLIVIFQASDYANTWNIFAAKGSGAGKASITFNPTTDRFGFEISNETSGSTARSTFSGAEAFLGLGWHIGIATYDESTNTTTFEVDGFSSNTTSYPGSGAYVIDKFRIGTSNNNTQGFDGGIVHFSVYPRVLTSQEIANARSRVFPADPDLFLAFPEGANDTVHDVSGNDHHGTVLTNGTVAAFWAGKINTERDYCIEYGGRLESGVFIPALLDLSTAANGLAVSIPPERRNPNALEYRDPFNAAELAGHQMAIPFSASDDIQNNFTPNNSMFRRPDVSGAHDRLITTAEPLTGTDLLNVEEYVA